MKTRNLITTSSLALTMMLGIVATPLSAQQTYTPGVTVEKNTNPEWEADYTATFIYKDKDARDATNVSVSGVSNFINPKKYSHLQILVTGLISHVIMLINIKMECSLEGTILMVMPQIIQ